MNISPSVTITQEFERAKVTNILGSLPSGSFFIFETDDRNEEAINSDLIYQKIDDPSVKEGSVKYVDSKTGKMFIRDSSHLTHPLKTKIQVSRIYKD